MMKKGFTLIELLVVVAIIGILASIVLISLNDARQGARDVKRIGDIRNVQLAMEIYFDDEGNYPPAAVPGTCENAEGGVLTTIGATGASDPSSGQNYIFGSPSGTTTPRDYVIGATLEDSGQAVLGGDVDGTVFGCGCDDDVYCVQP